MYKFVAIMVVGLMALSGSLGTVAAQEATLSKQDKEFFEKAALGGMLEVRLGEIASEKAASQDVKTFGKQMVRDHSEANKDLKSIAQKHNVTLPKELDKKHRDMVEKLSALKGKEFDREYMSEMVKDHDKDLKEFKKQAQEGKLPELKQFAASKVKTLEEHRHMAMEIDQKMKAKAD